MLRPTLSTIGDIVLASGHGCRRSRCCGASTRRPARRKWRHRLAAKRRTAFSSPQFVAQQRHFRQHYPARKTS
jgi:hypothetical protein